MPQFRTASFSWQSRLRPSNTGRIPSSLLPMETGSFPILLRLEARRPPLTCMNQAKSPELHVPAVP
jgi:hypothetical protein